MLRFALNLGLDGCSQIVTLRKSSAVHSLSHYFIPCGRSSSQRQLLRKEIRKAASQQKNKIKDPNKKEVALISGLKFVDMPTARASLAPQRRGARRVGRDASAFVSSKRTNGERHHHGFMIIARKGRSRG